ncbi:carcinoembryonic antigen-related cell adhesion molecule 5 [Colossoma macropomum]|uniref:carcinoembryonic antigen-related cell adhesion molecule 5 n=1 Tax=Colossoma macropomum TaxID=42526 RepID=UPI001864E568|nr:carcinoembryonic antigen-related cell adhesion molecule 5 [Colossoma macropomum]
MRAKGAGLVSHSQKFLELWKAERTWVDILSHFLRWTNRTNSALVMYRSPCKLTRLALVLICCITGCDCDLVVLPTGPTLINAFVGHNVTLGVSISGVSAPIVSWTNGTLTLATWTLGSSTSPVIAPESQGVLSVDQSGSLVFWNVPLSYNGTYTVTVTKVGARVAYVYFTLLVYESIMDVSLNTGLQDAVEGGPTFTLSYSSKQGQATGSQWYFNSLAVEGPRYSITGKSLTIRTPSRNDTGQYEVILTNPFSRATQQRNITVLYGPDQPVLEVSPTKAAFVSGETLSLSCRAEGEPAPSASWVFNGQALPTSSTGMLKLTDVQTSQSGIYTCVLVNTKTSNRLERSITIEVRGLSGSAIAGIAAGIPCGFLLLLFFLGLIALCYFCYKKKDRNPRYPVSRAVEKAVNKQPDLTIPHKLLTNGFKLPPDYNLLRLQTLSERAGPLPLGTVPVRMATTV